MRPVSFGCLGTAREVWTQAVAAVGSVYDVSSVRVVHTGFDGAGWCEGGRIRSRRASGRAIPRRGRAERVPTRALARRQARVERSLAKAGPTESQVVQSEGRGWEFPAQASTSGMRSDVRYESALTADRKLGYPQ